ncbi:MAG: class I SAM-dependent methyltransferase [Bacteroidetes bacterium]|nr:class I SAM-dependent methyltransferase [Bacteroidota bacterium]
MSNPLTLPEMQLLTPSNWKDYELIDTGGLEKLERFGKFILVRPEPQAVWDKSLPETEWERISHARYQRTKGVDPSKQEQGDKGDWKLKPGMLEQWTISYSYKEMHLKFRLGLTSFGHIGVFPEQAVNWDYIFDHLNASRVNRHATRVLNLFAYTGGSSLAARAAGAEVVHVDSVRPVVTWAKEDMEASGLQDIHWVVEDALKFVRREVKRGNHYDGIILDPPAYGRGPDGEKWILQDSINEMVKCCSQLLNSDDGFFILSLYSMGFSAVIADSLSKAHFTKTAEQETGELYFADRSGKKLPLGTFLRFKKQV